MFFKGVKFVAFLILAVASTCISSCKDGAKTIKETEVTFKKEGELSIYKSSIDTIVTTFDIEIADSDYEIQTGLMYRNSMKKNQGMLFVFNDVRERFFYMKNTRIPLDLIFIDETKTIVSFQKRASPLAETSLPSNLPAKYVLEVNAGMVDTWSLTVGDRIDYTEKVIVY